MLRKLVKLKSRQSKLAANGRLMSRLVWDKSTEFIFGEMRGELQAAHFYFAGPW